MKKAIKYLFLIFVFLSGCEKNNQNNGKEIIKEDICNWLEENYKNKRINDDIELPIKHPLYEYEIELFSFEEEYLDNFGKFNAPITDYETEILFIIKIDDEEYEVYIPVIFEGYADIYEAINYEIDKLVPERLDYSINLPTYIKGYDCQIEWESLDESIISKEGYINKDPNEDKYVVLNYIITHFNEKREYSRVIIINKMSNVEKIRLTEEWLSKELNDIEVINKDIELVNKYDLYNAYIKWSSWNPTVVTSKGKYYRPFNDEEVILEAKISVGTKSISYRYNFIAEGENNNNIWEKIESFLDKINIKEIKNQKFYLFGCEEGYERVLTQNLGYIPFYDEKQLEIKVDVLPSTSALKPNKLRDATKYIVIHNTGMAHPSATAKGLNDYIHSTDRVASWHFSVDDKEAYQELDIDEVGWHAGDGSYTYKDTWSGGIGGGNLNGIGIESCVYEGVDFNNVLRNVAKLSASLMIKYDLDMQSIKQHYDFSGKDCPQVIRHSDRWNELLNLIRLEYFAQTELKDVSFEFISLNKDILDDNGKIINHPGDEKIISYKVVARYNGIVKEYIYEAKLLELK